MPFVSSSGPSVKPGCSGWDMIGWARCVWGSTPPGETIQPAASITRAASVGSEPGDATTAICSPWMPTSQDATPCGVMTCPFLITRSSIGVAPYIPR
jgi:hypothetical protein